MPSSIARFAFLATPSLIGASAYPNMYTPTTYSPATIGTGFALGTAIHLSAMVITEFLFNRGPVNKVCSTKDERKKTRNYVLGAKLYLAYNLSTAMVIGVATKTGLIAATLFNTPVVMLTATTLFLTTITVFLLTEKINQALKSRDE